MPVGNPGDDEEEESDMDMDDDGEGEEEEEDWDEDDDWLMAPIGGLCVSIENLEHAHGTLTRKMGELSDAYVEDNIAIGEIRPKVTTLEGRVEVLGNQHDLMIDKIVEVEGQVLKMQDRADTHPCEQ
ncbi:hypothetical protein Tco_1449161, partial [Tanacetum coccineum]